MKIRPTPKALSNNIILIFNHTVLFIIFIRLFQTIKQVNIIYISDCGNTFACKLVFYELVLCEEFNISVYLAFSEGLDYVFIHLQGISFQFETVFVLNVKVGRTREDYYELIHVLALYQNILFWQKYLLFEFQSHLVENFV